MLVYCNTYFGETDVGLTVFVRCLSLYTCIITLTSFVYWGNYFFFT